MEGSSSSSASSTTFGPESVAEGLTQRKKTGPITNDAKAADKPKEKLAEFSHSQPVHTKPAPSILSSDNTEGLSLRGFGNLGRTILGYDSSKNAVLVMIFGNLRLIVENYVKVCTPSFRNLTFL